MRFEKEACLEERNGVIQGIDANVGLNIPFALASDGNLLNTGVHGLNGL